MAKKHKKFNTKDYIKAYNSDHDDSLYDDFDYVYDSRKIRKRKCDRNE